MVKRSTERADWAIITHSGANPYKRRRVRQYRLIQNVLHHIYHHQYVVVLGAPYSETTRLLLDVEVELRNSGRFFPIQINLRQARSDDEASFFNSLAQLIRRHLPPSDDLPLLDVVSDARSFQNFLNTLLIDGNHLVLLIDHLQTLPYDLIHSLLQSLRAAYMERNPDLAQHLDVVVTGNTSLADLSHGATSPFNIAHPILVHPLSEEQSRRLAEETFSAYGKSVSANALDLIWTWAGGDHFLLPYLCHLCQEITDGYSRPMVTRTVVERAVERLWQDDRASWPLREAVRLIEEDPDTLLDVLDILDAGCLPRNQARQPITRTGTNRLELCGAVALRESGQYCVKHEIYRRYLREHFTPARVGHVLRMTGRWQAAINYLAPRLESDPSLSGRTDLLEAIVQSIYAADNLDKAYTALVDGIRLGFGHTDVHVYRVDAALSTLQLVHPSGNVESTDTAIELNDDSRVEVQTFRNSEYALRSLEGGDKRLVAALVPEKRPIGVVTVQHYQTDADPRGIDLEMLELLRFLRHAAGAIENVMLRSAFQEIGRAVLDVGAVQSNLERVLRTISGALSSDSASLYLQQVASERLTLAAHVGLPAQLEISISTDLSNEHPVAQAWRAPRQQPPMPVTSRVDSPSTYIYLFLPLIAGGERLGVLSLGFGRSRQPQINEEYRRTLGTFADQAAIAVYNMQLLQRTDEALSKRVEELERARRELEILRQREMVDLVYAFSHRLGNMIGDVPHHLKLIHERIDLIDHSLSEALIHVEQRVSDLQDLMDLVEHATIMPEIFTERVDLRHLLTEAVARCLPRSGIVYDTFIDDAPIWVLGNSILLRDAFVTLIDNACEAVSSGGHIAISMQRTLQQQIHILVEDDGPGIPPEYHSRIFEPGFSTKAAAGQIRGKGLFTCRQIVFRHGGRVYFDSQLGIGTSFCVELPLIGAY